MWRVASRRRGSLIMVTAPRIVTQDGPDAQAMVLFADRVLATGSVDGMSLLAQGAERRDYEDATIVPGFNDAHQHLTMMASQALGLDMSDSSVDGPQALAAALRSHAAGVSAGSWVIATRYDHMRSSGGQRLTRAQLDAVVPDRPVVVVHIGAHRGVVNSAALAAAGLRDDTPDPPGGEIGKDVTGRLDGFVSEQALFDFVYPSLASRDAVAPPPAMSALTPALLASAEKMLAAGITSVCDAMVGPRELQLLQSARDQGLPFASTRC